MQLQPATNRTVVKGKVLELAPSNLKELYKQLLKKSVLLEKEKAQLKATLDEIDDLYNHAPCGYHSLDEKGFFTRINQTELNWLGYSEKELLGKMKFTDIIHPKSLKTFNTNFPAFKKNGFIQELEFNLIRKNGEVFTVLLSATAIYDEKGKYRMSRSILFDITERKQLEKKLLEQNEKLYWLNQEKDRFIGIASHDLQHPIAAITLLSEHLLGSKTTLLDPEVREICEMISQSAGEMQTLIKNYLDITRFETGLLHLKKQPVDLSQLTRQVTARYQSIASKKNILLQFAATGTAVFEADPHCIEQILENLLSNAIKFSNPGKKVFIKVYPENKDFVLEIKDQGVGIPKKELPFLFEKFQRLSSKPTGGELSTGLGLSIVKFLTEQSGGVIEVSSKPRQGTTFRIRFAQG